MLAVLRRINQPRVFHQLLALIEHKNGTNAINMIKSTPTCSRLVGLETIRFKSGGSKKSKMNKKESDSETEAEKTDNELFDKHTKLMKVTVTSLRVDALLKAGLGVARNKIETMFYESKIRVNGGKISKKSATVSEGDEIDIIKGTNSSNPDMLVVSRLEIVSFTPKDDGESISVKLRRFKSLIIENNDKWKPKE